MKPKYKAIESRALTCDGKIKYVKFADAQKRIKLQQKRGDLGERVFKVEKLQVYRCEFCHFYHVGSARK